MGYQTLYRKWRPVTFDEVRGQNAIVTTLKNQLKNDHIGHAYLFSGTRGTGKTTCAKIFARAVNCEHPVNGNPCNACPTCKSILAGTSMNVLEIDAASNSGVDNIREIRDEVAYRPTEGRYRVYILDEVHMLSPGAYNALLKTLEEPPEYVIFILATTEPQKLPITILSRCQRYDFKRLTKKELEDQLRFILAEEKTEAEEEAISYLARCADGSSRDALTLLESCVSAVNGSALTYEKALDALGAVDTRVFSELLREVLKGHIKVAFDKVDEILLAGRELTQFANEFIWYLRNMMLLQTENAGEEILGISKENRERMREEAAQMDLNQIMRYITILSKASNDLRYATNKRVLLELALIRMMQPSLDEDYESLKDRIRYLENKMIEIAEGKTDIVRMPEEPKKAVEDFSEKPEKEEKKIEVPVALYEDYQKVKEDWQDILASIDRMYSATLEQGTFGLDEKKECVLYFSNPFYKTMAETCGGMEELRKKLSEKYNKEFRITAKDLTNGEAAPKVILSSHVEGIGMEIEG